MDAPSPSPPTEAVDVLATPAVHRMANELNVDLNEVIMMSYVQNRLLCTHIHTHTGAGNW